MHYAALRPTRYLRMPELGRPEIFRGVCSVPERVILSNYDKKFLIIENKFLHLPQEIAPAGASGGVLVSTSG